MATCSNLLPGILLNTGKAVPGKGGGKPSNSYQTFSGIIKGIIGKSNRTAQQFNPSGEPIKAEHLIGELKKHITALSMNAKKVKLDDRAAFSLEKLLLDAGFEKTSVSELMGKIKNKHHENGMTLSALFKALEKLDKPGNEEDQLIDISALPYLNSIFKMFGMDNATVDRVLSDATVEGAGIDIARLISALENKGYMDKSMLQRFENEQKISDMMDRIKISDQEQFSGKINLETFVLKLKGMVAKHQGTHVADTTLTKEAKTFINQLAFDEYADTDEVFFNKINKIKTFDPVAKMLSSEEHKAFSTNEALTSKPEAGLNLSSVSGEMQSLLKIAGKVDTADLSERTAPQATIRNTTIKATEINPSGSKNGSHLNTWNGDTWGVDRLASASTEKMPGSKLLPSYMLNQVSRQIVKSVENGNTEIRLQLKPPHLGRLQITIETLNDTLKVNIVTEHHATRDMLMANSTELKTILFDQGIRLEKVEVQLAFNFDQSMSNAKHDFQKPKSRKNNPFSLSGDVQGADTATGKDNWSGPMIQARLLDLVA